MASSNHSVIIQCLRPTCQFRFPAMLEYAPVQCPKCGSPTRISQIPAFETSSDHCESLHQNQRVEILLDNIRSAYNVGSIMRSADASGIAHIHCAGITPTPDQPKVRKTALGAENLLPWTQYWNALDCINQSKNNGFQILAFEFVPSSTSLFDFQMEFLCFPVLLVFGNEVSGVDPQIIQMADYTIRIPMYGEKSSVNVATASGIAMYFIRYFAQKIQQDR